MSVDFESGDSSDRTNCGCHSESAEGEGHSSMELQIGKLLSSTGTDSFVPFTVDPTALEPSQNSLESPAYMANNSVPCGNETSCVQNGFSAENSFIGLTAVDPETETTVIEGGIDTLHINGANECTNRTRHATTDSTDSVQYYVTEDCDLVFKDGIEYRPYGCEKHLVEIMELVSSDLSEPYSIYTYRYFIYNWPKLCIRALDVDKCVGAIVCKRHTYEDDLIRGYIAMLVVDKEYRRRGIGTQLVLCAIKAMAEDNCDDVVLEAEIDNLAALQLYENMGFIRDKRLHRYYLNGNDAFRLHLLLN